MGDLTKKHLFMRIENVGKFVIESKTELRENGLLDKKSKRNI